MPEFWRLTLYQYMLINILLLLNILVDTYIKRNTVIHYDVSVSIIRGY